MKLRVENEVTEICGSLCREEQHRSFCARVKRARVGRYSDGRTLVLPYAKQVSELRSETDPKYASESAAIMSTNATAAARLQRLTRKQAAPKMRRCALGQVDVD
jgi:hypothetical protein